LFYVKEKTGGNPLDQKNTCTYCCVCVY